MKFTRLLTAVIVACVLATGVNSYLNHSEVNIERPDKLNPIVKLLTNGRFICTAFIISNKYAVTASHCVYNPMFRAMGLKNDDSFTISNVYEMFKIPVEVIGLDPRVDFAVLKGDFSHFKHLKIDVMGDATYQGNQVLACGYPHNAYRLKCARAIRAGTNFFQLTAVGELLFPGHSGGPAIDTETGLVVGINSAVHPGFISFAPVLSIPDIIANYERKHNEGSK